MMDPKRDQLETPSASTVLKHPDSSVPRTGREDEPPPPAACPLAWVRHLGGDTSSPTERVIETRAGVATAPADSSKTVSLQTSRQPKDKEK